jgi:hypothetical protein
MIVTRLECPTSGVVLEGRFSLGWIGRLTGEQLDFAGLLVRHRGNVQKVAAELGMAYNTARSRMDEIVQALGGGPEADVAEAARARPEGGAVLEQLERGEIDFEEALRRRKRSSVRGRR